MPTFVNRGQNVFRDPNDPELPNLDAGQIEAPETREVISGAPTDDMSKQAFVADVDTSNAKPRYVLLMPETKPK